MFYQKIKNKIISLQEFQSEARLAIRNAAINFTAGRYVMAERKLEYAKKIDPQIEKNSVWQAMRRVVENKDQVIILRAYDRCKANIDKNYIAAAEKTIRGLIKNYPQFENSREHKELLELIKEVRQTRSYQPNQTALTTGNPYRESRIIGKYKLIESLIAEGNLSEAEIQLTWFGAAYTEQVETDKFQTLQARINVYKRMNNSEITDKRLEKKAEKLLAEVTSCIRHGMIDSALTRLEWVINGNKKITKTEAYKNTLRKIEEKINQKIEDIKERLSSGFYRDFIRAEEKIREIIFIAKFVKRDEILALKEEIEQRLIKHKKQA